MREFLFRAKRLDNGEWACSKTIASNTPLEGGDGIWFIGAGQPADQYIDKNGNMIAVETTGKCLFYAIDPETVGQYTGRKDKNGARVFEGDILQTFTVWADGTREAAGIGIVQWWGNDQCYVLATKQGHHIEDFGNLGLPEYYEVIGNIHDNPELLKED